MLSGYAIQSLARAMAHPIALRCKTIGPRLREQLVLRVSALNRCAVCSAIHGFVAKVEGLTKDEIREARAALDDAGHNERTRVALRFAELRTAQQEADFPEAVEAFEREFSGDEQREVRAIVDLFTFNNRFNNTWESVLPGADRRRRDLEPTT
jgi:AhpD family alkylhydroperoxidase